MLIKKYKITSLTAFAVGLAALPLTGFAGDEPSSKDDGKTPAPTPPIEHKISGDLGLSVTSQYISRGLVLNNEGAINQHYADLYFDMYDSTGFLTKVQLNLGIWFDLDPHSTQAGTAHSGPNKVTLPWWYEFDFTPGVTFTFAKIFTFTPSYYVFTSPADAFRTFQGLNLNFGLDDSQWLGKFALHPSFTYLRELSNKAGDGPSKGNYFEFGVTPSVPAGPVTVNFPLTVGVGSDGFYGNNGSSAHFGYFTPGVNVAVPLKFIPPSYGTWTFNTGYKFYYLGDDLANFNTEPGPPNFRPGEDDSVRKATHFEHQFSGGIVLNF